MEEEEEEGEGEEKGVKDNERDEEKKTQQRKQQVDQDRVRSGSMEERFEKRECVRFSFSFFRFKNILRHSTDY